MALIPRRLRDAFSADDQDFLDECADMGQDRIAGYTRFGSYYNGDQRASLTDRARLYLEASGLPFCENFCEPVIDVMAERMKVTGFANASLEEAAEGEQQEDEIGVWAGEVWQRSRLDAVQGVVHTTGLNLGDSFLIVDFDEGEDRPRFSFNHSHEMKPVYSQEEPGRLAFAVKKWTTSTFHPRLNVLSAALVRMNLYYPDRIEKFFRLHRSEGKGGWQRWTDITVATDGSALEDPWPVPWTDQAGLPLGVPVFHFRNRPLGAELGRSELRGVIPFQDELTKLLIDLNETADYHGFPQFWVSGVQGSNVTYKRVPGSVWQAEGAEAKFGAIEPGNLEQLLNAVESCLSRLARRTRTPMHLLTSGDMPSGEALKSAEAGLVAKVKDRQVTFGNEWEDAMLFAHSLATEFAVSKPPAAPADLVLSTVWDDPESRNDKEELETAEIKRRLGVSKATILQELGYDPEVEAARRSTEAEEAAEAVGSLLDRGDAPFGGREREPVA